MKLTGTYLDGFLLPVPTAKLEEYRDIASKAAAIWTEHGALHYIEAAADDLDSDFCRSFAATADAKEDETVIFAFAIFADKAARDAANAVCTVNRHGAMFACSPHGMCQTVPTGRARGRRRSRTA